MKRAKQKLFNYFWKANKSGLNIKDINGVTTLMIACRNGHNGVVQLLLDHSKRIDISLFLWTQRCCKIAPKYSEGIELNTKSKIGMTGFMLACRRGHKEVVKLLLDHSNRIELNVRCNDEGYTRCILACIKGRKNVVQLLLNHSKRIDLNASSNNGRTAFMIACK